MRYFFIKYHILSKFSFLGFPCRISFRLLPLYLVLVLFFFTGRLSAGSWNSLQFRYQINEKWVFNAEAQLRSLRFYDHFHYHEYKAWMLYRLRPELTLALGAGDYDTYGSGGDFVVPKNNDEFRLWPQLQVLQNIGKVKIEHRYRFEMRFADQGYRNRFRYRIQLNYPLFGAESRWSVQASSELFFTNRVAYFERVRSQAGLNIKLNRHLSLLPGYLYQFDYRINDETGRDFVVMGLLISY
jgi:hypothetical protein